MACFLILSALALSAPAMAATCDAVLRDPQRSRSIPVRLTMPDNASNSAQVPIPLILWSPGLGGGLAQGSLYAQAWAKAGLATLQFSHPGSDAQVYKEAEARARAAEAAESSAQAAPQAARAARAARVREATSSAQVNARLADLAFAVSRLPFGLGRCSTQSIDQSRLGIAGHSMGAWMAQILIGQRLDGSPPQSASFKAAIAVSGSPLAPAPARAASVAGISRPFLLVTGSLDGIAPGLPPEAASAQLAERMGLWPHLPPGGKYLYVAAGANHMQLAGTNASTTTPALAERLLPILTGFWLETLKDGPKRQPPALAEKDLFQTK